MEENVYKTATAFERLNLIEAGAHQPRSQRIVEDFEDIFFEEIKLEEVSPRLIFLQPFPLDQEQVIIEGFTAEKYPILAISKGKAKTNFTKYRLARGASKQLKLHKRDEVRQTQRDIVEFKFLNQRISATFYFEKDSRKYYFCDEKSQVVSEFNWDKSAIKELKFDT